MTRKRRIEKIERDVMPLWLESLSDEALLALAGVPRVEHPVHGRAEYRATHTGSQWRASFQRTRSRKKTNIMIWCLPSRWRGVVLSPWGLWRLLCLAPRM